MERELRKNKALWALFDAIVCLQTNDECARFLRDLCTLAELQAMAERWEVARMLAEEVSYRQISEQTGCSTATITRIAHWLHHGEGGYRMMLDRVRTAKEQANKLKG
jgi:TrpR-related protein YerC/YecD